MLLPHDGMIGMSPQVGRVSVPMAGITRLRTSDGRRCPALRGVWSEGGRILYVLLVPYDGRGQNQRQPYGRRELNASTDMAVPVMPDGSGYLSDSFKV